MSKFQTYNTNKKNGTTLSNHEVRDTSSLFTMKSLNMSFCDKVYNTSSLFAMKSLNMSFCDNEVYNTSSLFTMNSY